MTLTTSLLTLAALTPTRPSTRADCPPRDPETGRRGCLFVTCRHHLYLDITVRGRLRLNFDDLEDMSATCSLDVADGQPLTLEAVGRVMGDISRERVRQIEQQALKKFREMSTPHLLEHHGLKISKQARSIMTSAGRAASRKPTKKRERYSALTPWLQLSRGSRVRRIRQRLGWSATSLSSLTGSSRSALFHVERDSWTRVSEAVLKRYMATMNVDLKWLESQLQPAAWVGTRSAEKPLRSKGDQRLDYLMGLPQVSVTPQLELERERMTRRLSVRQMALLFGMPVGRYVRAERGHDPMPLALRRRVARLIRARQSNGPSAT